MNVRAVHEVPCETFDIHAGGIDLVFPHTKTRLRKAKEHRKGVSVTGCTSNTQVDAKRCRSRRVTLHVREVAERGYSPGPAYFV